MIGNLRHLLHMCLASTCPVMKLRLQGLVCKQPLLGWNGPTAPLTRTLTGTELPL